MIGGNIRDFTDQLNYGQEIVFSYQGKKYFIQGWWSSENCEASLVLTDESSEEFTGYLWEHHDPSMERCAEAFLTTPIWDGKNFLQIEKEVTWTDW